MPDPLLAEIVCECELVTRAELDIVLGDSCAVPALDDRRCRSAHASWALAPARAPSAVTKRCWPDIRSRNGRRPKLRSCWQTYLHDRWKGQAWVPDGKQAEQLSLSKELFGPACNVSERR